MSRVSRRFAGALGVAGPLFLVAVPAGAKAQEARVVSPAQAACRIVDLRARQPGQEALLGVACGGRTAVIGQAQAYTSAYDAAASSLLVVRKLATRTEISAVMALPGVPIRVEELAPTLLRDLPASIDRSAVDVDLSAFAATGRIAVSSPGKGDPVARRTMLDLRSKLAGLSSGK